MRIWSSCDLDGHWASDIKGRGEHDSPRPLALSRGPSLRERIGRESPVEQFGQQSVEVVAGLGEVGILAGMAGSHLATRHSLRIMHQALYFTRE
jgi:hypothetical protein